jgi:catechol-2,3-dioxygenase
MSAERTVIARPGGDTAVVRIDAVRLRVADLVGAERLFGGLLDLPVTRVATELHVQVGRTRLLLTEGRDGTDGAHHLAFDVPAGVFAAHRDWLAARVPLLANRDGATEFEGPPGWNSRSVYFEGPDRMILELIARRNRSGSAIDAVPGLESISEVGIAVADVPATMAALGREHGLEPYQGVTDEFAPVGDEEGLLILVSEGRPWYPTLTTSAQRLPLTIDVTVPAAAGGEHWLNPVALLRANAADG